MRRKIWISIAACLLLVTAAWLLWPRGNGAVPKASAPASPVAAVAPATNTVVAAKKASQLATGTNRFAFRLSNTKASLVQLTHNAHAVLLQNAFLDTSLSLTGLDIPAKLKSNGHPGAYIVQARGPIDAAFRTLLSAVGAQVVSYIPNNAYLVNASAGSASVLSGNALVQAVLPYEPYYKLQPSLLGLVVEDQPLPPGTGLTLGLFGLNGMTPEQVLPANLFHIASVSQSPFGPIVSGVALGSLATLAQNPYIQVMEVTHQRRSANDLARVALGISTDTLTPTNYLNLTGKNVMVEVNDTGIDPLHPDFSVSGSASNAPSGGSRVFGDSPQSLLDTIGHGTFVAGIIAGNGAESLTLTNPPQGSVTNADLRGKAPQATLFSVGGIAGGHDPLAISDYYLQAAPALTNALISNNSWVYGGDFDYDLASASYDAATRDALPFRTGSQPVLFVFAAGNDGGGDDDGSGGSADTIHSPGTAKNVITVGALEQPRGITNIVTDAQTNSSAIWEPATDSSSQVASYSSRGNVGINTEGPFGRFKPDVVAPGSFVVSTTSENWDTNAYYSPTNTASTDYTFQLAATNALNNYNVSVPPNTVGVTITITTNQLSPTPFPTLLLYAQLVGNPDPVGAPGSIDITSANNKITIPPGGGAITIASIQNNGFQFAVANTNALVVNYDLTVTITTTNDLGDYYSVLEGLNDTLAPWYHYESGTSMATPAVSGVLALIQDYFTNTLQLTPSPALLKAMLINGSRSVGGYSYAITNGNNFEGWGLPSIINSLPLTSGAQPFTPSKLTGATSPLFFVDQSPTNALATGASHTYIIHVDTNPNDFAQYLNLQATLVWTDPPGDPNAAIKLVNNLDLVITNLDAPTNIYFGNDIQPSLGYNLPWNTNAPPNLDTINNVENIILPPLLAGNYSVTVIGREVNVNAVTAQASDVVQDFALVVSVGEGEVPGAITSVDDSGATINPTAGQQITVVTTTNSPLFNQFVGANSPFVGTNTLTLGTNTVWGNTGQLTVGVTNQWHFYLITNTGTAADFTNAVFATFNAVNLSVPRLGVFEEADPANATRPEADIDIYASTDAGLTNLSPVTVSNCLAGVGDNHASIGQGGTEFVYFADSAPGTVYYVGVKSEDQMASEYAFLPLFTDTPLSTLDKNGNQVVNGQLLAVPIPDGTPAHPGITNVFGFAIMQMTVENVSVLNWNQHQNFGDLVGSLTFDDTSVVLNTHDGYGNTYNNTSPDTGPLLYDDSAHPAAVSGIQPRHTDGPGNLTSFRTKTTPGMFILNEIDNSHTQTGQVSQLTMTIQPHRDLLFPGVIVDVPPGGWFVDYITVPPGYTNLTFYATNLPPTIQPALQMYERFNAEPTLTGYDQRADLTNCIVGTYPTGLEPGNLISVGPPLASGDYFIAIYNPSLTDATNVFISATLGADSTANLNFNYTSTGAQSLLPDGVTANSTISMTATQLVQSVSVGLVVQSSQISDYTFTLVSPTGQRVLLMENRGGNSTNGAGTTFIYTNIVNAPATGNADPNTNYLAVMPAGELVPITYNFYGVPDQMTVYDGTNPATFYLGSPTFLYDTGMTNTLNGPVTINVNSQPGYTNITIIMNQFGNTNGIGGDKWDYTAGAAITNYSYLAFTDDTNLANVPIKFAATPYGLTDEGTNFTLSDFELATNGIYQGSNNIPDAFGGWTVPTNLVTYTTVVNVTNSQFQTITNTLILTNNRVSVVTDPANSLGDHVGSNYLALADGTITRSIPTIPGRIYNVTYWSRGPGIASWWRGEGNASDSSDPEKNGNNGTLVGRFNFPAGEVGQAFQFEDGGNEFDFAGTNTYVQIPQSPSLDVGKAGGFTVEGWINPTNLAQPQPVLEWLAQVPTNSAVTNLVIKAGPYWNPATSHYYYMLGSTDWVTSEQWAVALGGHLATVDTANEQNWVFDNFASYGGFNHNLWLGLTNTASATQPFIWSSGLTNITYTNWVTGQPLNPDGNHNYTGMLGETNLHAGLWVLATTNGFISGSATTNKFYGVVEVNNIQTNGVQFWISVTNTPGTTNAAFVNSNGCLYANIIDTNYVSHEIFSAPGLLQSNVYQHVALTYDTNSGIAMLYLNGTNVATTNFGAPFVPKTDGDVLLGRDMSPNTNNYYGGLMDEMSIYRRPLSGSEIEAIYQVSAFATNGTTGKFDPTITPAVGLSEAAVIFGTTSNVIYGLNNQWEQNSYTFTASSNSMPLRITGLEPGILLDNFAVAQAPLTNLYYLPEQTLAALTGTSALGDWSLQVWDNLNNAAVTNLSQLLSWQLSFILESNSPVAASLPPEAPVSSTVPAGQTVYYYVPVPSWAHFATNILVSSSVPVDLLFNPTNLPSASNPGNPGDQTLLTASTRGASTAITVNTNLPFTAQSQAYQSYYLGVRNPGPNAAAVVLQVNYDLTALTNSAPFTTLLNTNDSVRYYTFNVSSNAYEATFQLLKLSGNADLVVSKGTPLPTLTNSAYGSFNVSNLDESIYVLTNSSPVPLSAGTWYLGVVKRDSGVVNYSVLAKELDYTSGPITNSISIIPLTNGVPFNYTAVPGAALTNFFVFHATNSTPTNLIQGVRFEVYNLTGNGDLVVQTNALPLSPPFFQTSQNPRRSPELVLVYTNSALTNLAADWYLGVPNNEITNINYTIVAVIETNSYFPAFPGAAGAGGGAVGGRFGTVYHVTTTADSGPGSLRAAVSVTNRTVVFDVNGTIQLASPLVITNSYLTIAGQTAPGGGITVAGGVTTVSSAHDVVIRDVRFRQGGNSLAVVWANGFESTNQSTTYPAGNHIAGWLVDFGSSDWFVTGFDGFPSYQGNNFVDLDGSSAGGISTNIPTVSGVAYTLNFAYTRNPGLGSIPAPRAQVLINGNALATVTANFANSAANPEWQTTSFVFTATSPSTMLAFHSLDPANNIAGVYLDSVSLSAAVGDSFQFLNASNVIADHVSASWSANNLLSVLGSTNVTVQWSIMADSLLNTNNPLGFGSLVRGGSGAISLHHNLYADNYNASPSLGDNISLDFVNNVIYNWGIQSGFSITNDNLTAYPNGVTNQLNYVANYLIAGPDTAYYATNLNITNIAFVGSSTNTWIFQTNNFIDSNTNGILDGANTQWAMFTNQYTPFAQPFALLQVPTDEAFLAYEKVMDFAGVNSGFRDSVDTDIAYKIRVQTGRIISTPASDMVAWWKAEGNTLDSVGGNNGINQNVTYTNGVVGQAFNFNGSASSYISVPASTNLNIGATGSGITIEGWINPNYSAAQDLPIVEWDSASTDGVQLWAETSYRLYMNLKDTAGNAHTLFSPNNLINTNTWQHVAGTYNKNTGIAALYINGVAVASTNFGNITPQTTYSLLNIGRRTGQPIGLNQTYHGKMDEISLYNRALTPGEITAVYTASHAGKFQTQTGVLFQDTDQDGIPDFWEKMFGSDRFTPDSTQLSNLGDGYTYLEEYNNWLAGPHLLTVTNTPAGVDLMQIFGNTGNLSFSVSNAVSGSVFLTNILGSVTNSGPWSNSIAIFTPTNAFSGMASFDVYVTNTQTVAYFGPVTVKVAVSGTPIAINSNTPPVIITLTNAVAYANTNFGGSDYYKITVTNSVSGSNAIAALFSVTNATGPVVLVARYGLPLPSLSSYDYISTNSWLTSENIFVTTNSTPVALANGDWYLAVVNVAGSNVTYSVKATIYYSLVPPVFIFPTNNMATNIVETFPFSMTCVAVDSNTPPLPLTFTLLNQPTNVFGATNVMTIDPTTGVLNWTPNEAQGPSTNVIQISVSNGSFTVTNSFTINVLESNTPPFWLPGVPAQTNYVIAVSNLLTVMNTATDTDIPINPLTYTLAVSPSATNAVIDTNTGIITWTPTLAQAGTNYVFTTIVTDTNQWASVGGNSLSATNTIYVTVLQPNLIAGQPQTNTVAAGGISWFQVNVPTNAIAATNWLLFATNLPVNVWFSTNVPPTTTTASDVDLIPNAMNGFSVLTTNTSPTNIIAGEIYFLGVQNPNGVAVTFGLQVDFAFSVPPITNAVSISSIIYTNISGTNGFWLTWFAPSNELFQVQWTTSLAPANWSNFNQVVSYNPAAVPVSPTNARFNFFDNGTQTGGFGPTRYYRLNLLSSGAAGLTLPSLPTNVVAGAGVALTVTNTATDSNPSVTLHYTLVTLPTNNAAISNGFITWTPPATTTNQTFAFTTVVTDGTLSATNSFNVFVASIPSISHAIITSNGVSFQWLAGTNQQFKVQWTTNLAAPVWMTFPGIITSTNGTFNFTDTNAAMVMKFYELILQP